jgi:ABC-2 type transport system ATP-binding protein
LYFVAVAAVDVSGLVKRYGGTTAVAGLGLSLPTGTVLALLGPNGAGKTTTVEICSDWTPPRRARSCGPGSA